MCQYHPRCPTKQHRPGTICPYAGRGGARSAWAPTPPPAARRESTPARVSTPAQRRDRARNGGSGAGDLASLLVLFAVTSTNEQVDVGPLVLLVLVVLAPFAIGTWLTMTCTAWRVREIERCNQPRRGIFYHCADHSGMPTLYDMVALASYAFGVLNAVVLVQWLLTSSPA